MALHVLCVILITSGCAQEVPSAAWQLLSPVGTPPVQRGPRAVWSAEADGLFVHGGTGIGDGDLGLHFYDRQADEWQQLSPSGSAAARDSHSAVWSPTADGMYIFGGNSYSGERLNELNFYSRQANKWQHLAPGGSIPVARRDHSAVWSPEADGMYLFAGSNFHGIGHMNDLHFYDRQANAWQQLRPAGGDGADGPSPREHHTAVWAPSTAQGGRDGMYVFGGFNGSHFLNDLHFYDRKANQWHQLFAAGVAPSPRYQHSAAWESDGMYVFGGWGITGPTSDVHFYDRQANAWRAVTPSGFVPKQHGHAAVWSPSGIYVVGDADLYCYKEVASSNETTTSVTTSTAFTTVNQVMWSGNLQFTLDGDGATPQITTAVQKALATWFGIPESSVQVATVELTTSGRRLAQLWLVTFQIQMDAAVVPDFQGAALESFASELKTQLEAAGLHVNLSGLEVSMELVEATEDEGSNRDVIIIVVTCVVCAALGATVAWCYCRARPTSKAKAAQETPEADIEIHAAASAEPVPLEIDDAPIPAVPVPAAPAAPWQDVEHAPCRQLPTAVPEYWSCQGAWTVPVDESTLDALREIFGDASKLVDCAWRIEKEDLWMKYAEERNKVLQQMDQLQRQKISLEQWTSRVEEASRKLPGELCAEVGEHFLFQASDGGLDVVEDQKALGKGVYLTDQPERITHRTRLTKRTESNVEYCFVVRTTCGACLQIQGSNDKDALEVFDDQMGPRCLRCVPGASPPFSFHSVVSTDITDVTETVCFGDALRCYPEYLVAYRLPKAAPARISL